MSFERMPGPMAAEPARPAAGDLSIDPSRAALRLQVLATEHWGLLATRSLVWNETFTRAGMFLSALSGAIVALALVAQATAFGDAFHLFALAILPVVLFIGVATLVRIGKANYHEAMCVVGMNRIRQAYLQLVPEVEPFLVMSPHDDDKSLERTMGLPPGTGIVQQVVVSTPFVVSIVNSVLGAVIGAIISQRLGLDTSWAVGAGLLGFGLVSAVQGFAAGRDISVFSATYRPMFPAPATAPAPETQEPAPDR